MIFAILGLSAFLFSQSFPGFIFPEGAGILAWICYVPLFLACTRIPMEKSPLYGFFYGVLSYGLLTWWLWNYSPWFFILAIMFYGFLYALLMPLLVLTCKTLNPVSFFCQAVILLAFEYIKTLGFLGFSYGITGYTQWKNPYLIQIADKTGVYGISALVLWTNAVLSRLIFVIKKRRIFNKKVFQDHHNHKYSPVHFEMEMAALKKQGGLGPIISTSVCMALLILGAFIYGKNTCSRLESKVQASPKIKVCAVQHNENSREDGILVYTQNIRRLCNLTDEALALHPDTQLVVWPETAVPTSIMYQYYYGKDERRQKLVNILLNYIDGKDCSFVIGNFHKEKSQDFNSALYFVPTKNVIPPEPEIYNKNHLVPMSEAYPFKKSFDGIKRFMEKQGASFWTAGEEITVWTGQTKDNTVPEGFSFSTPICFEDTFPALARKMVLKGSRAFVNLTNDSWGRSLACQNQHLAMACFRSVENHVPSVRSATSGQTGIIDIMGRPVLMATYKTEAFVTGEMPVLQDMEQTFYTKHGDVFAYGCCLVAAVMLIMALIRGIIILWQNR